MPPCYQEEADSRICVHLKDCLEKGARKKYVRTVDTDVIVILSGIFFKLQSIYADLDIWVAFGMGKIFQYYHMNSICQSFGERKCRGLPFFHTFTGCDTTSQFSGKGKKSSWEVWKSYSDATEAFEFATDNPFQPFTESSKIFEVIERFTCILYDKSTIFPRLMTYIKSSFLRELNLWKISHQLRYVCIKIIKCFVIIEFLLLMLGCTFATCQSCTLPSQHLDNLS